MTKFNKGDTHVRADTWDTLFIGETALIAEIPDFKCLLVLAVAFYVDRTFYT